MSNSKKFFEKLMKLSGATTLEDGDPYEHVVPTDSPSMNFVWGPGGGMPRGYTLAIGGPPRGGKTLITNAFASGAHKSYEDGLVIKFDTEMRTKAQSSKNSKLAANMGIDFNRFIAYQVNEPDKIFDRIETDLYAQFQDGANIPLIIIDSINGIQGRRTGNSKSVMDQQIGDRALTLQDGFARILPKIREMNSSLILTTQIRADIGDGGKYELNNKKYRGATIKLAMSYSVLHYAEFWMYIEKVGGAKGIKDFKEKNVIWANDEEAFGHRVRAQMLDASFGPKARKAEFTIDYEKGIVDTHEEVFRLGVYSGDIYRPNNRMYEFGNQEWNGAEAILDELKNNPELCNEVMKAVRESDLSGKMRKKFLSDEEVESAESE